MQSQSLTNLLSEAIRLNEAAKVLAKPRTAHAPAAEQHLAQCEAALEPLRARKKSCEDAVAQMRLAALRSNSPLAAEGLAQAQAALDEANRQLSQADFARLSASVALNKAQAPLKVFERVGRSLNDLKRDLSGSLFCYAEDNTKWLRGHLEDVVKEVRAWYPILQTVAEVDAEVARLSELHSAMSGVVKVNDNAATRSLAAQAAEQWRAAWRKQNEIRANAKAEIEAVAPFNKSAEAVNKVLNAIPRLSHFQCPCSRCQHKRYLNGLGRGIREIGPA